MDGFGGLGLAAKISGLWPKGWGDARMLEEDEPQQGGVQRGGVQYVDGDPSQGRWNTAQEWEDPPPDTNGVPYSEQSHYDEVPLLGISTDPRPGMGGVGGGPRWGQ